MGYYDMNWAHMAQNRDEYRALVNTKMNILVQKKKVGNFFTM